MNDYNNAAWQKKNKLTVDVNNMISTRVGTDHGVTAEELNGLAGTLSRIHEETAAKRKKAEIAFFELPYQKQSVAEIAAAADKLKGRFENLVVLGIGGSALGMTALHTALHPPHYNLLPGDKRGGTPRLFVADNIDPAGFQGLLNILDMEKTVFNVISKSGETAETMSQFLIIKELLEKKLGKSRACDHIIITTDAKKGLLREIVKQEKCRSFVVPDGVGGRFSVLTAVGLLPAALTGIDIEELLAGAAFMDALCQKNTPFENPALLLAGILYLLDTKKSKALHVMMPYVDALKDIADWFRQLWAESLGKKYAVDGQEVYAGPTPIKALGVTDQHSQSQLYNEGPNNKAIVFLAVADYGADITIPEMYKELEGVGYLGGHGLAELIQAERRATELALTKNRRPNATITLPRVNPFTVGQLLYLLEVQTAYAGTLYNINPFDQPGVEEGKQLTYGLMGRKGYEKKREEVENQAGKDKRYII